MAARSLPNLALKAFYSLGEDSWNLGVDQNFLKLSTLVQGGVAGVVDSLTSSPTEGLVNILSTASSSNPNSVAVYSGGHWTFYAPAKGWMLFNGSTNSYMIFDGTVWQVLPLANMLATGSLDTTSGLVEQTGANTFTKRTIGVGAANSIPTRSDNDARYALIAGGSFSGPISAANLTGTNTGDQHISLSGDVTAAAGTAGLVTSIGSNKVSDAMLAQLASQTFKGRISAGTGNVEVLSATDATSLLNTFTTTAKGLVPAPTVAVGKFLKDDGSWSPTPAAGGSNRGSFQSGIVNTIWDFEDGLVPSSFTQTSPLTIVTDSDGGTTKSLAFAGGPLSASYSDWDFSFPVTADATHSSVTIRAKINSYNVSSGAIEGVTFYLDGVSQGFVTQHADAETSYYDHVISGLSAGPHTIRVNFHTSAYGDVGFENIYISQITAPTTGGAVTYNVGDIVTYSGRTWVCATAGTTAVPSSLSADWFSTHNKLRELLDYDDSVAPLDGQSIVWNATASKFKPGPSGTWGSITGSLSSQTDLQSALNAKANVGIPITNYTSATYTLALVDANSYLRFSNAGNITITVPLSSAVNFAVGTTIRIIQGDVGQVLFTPAAGVTVNASDAYRLRKQFSACMLIKTATDTWDLIGDLDFDSMNFANTWNSQYMILAGI